MRCIWIPLISALLLTPVPALADTLLVDSIKQQSGTASGSPSVSRGMTMEQVERKLGAPVSKLPAVGQPPITRWIYAGHTVYFEHNLVLTSVSKR
mgnify:FL=1